MVSPPKTLRITIFAWRRPSCSSSVGCSVALFARTSCARQAAEFGVDHRHEPIPARAYHRRASAPAATSRLQSDGRPGPQPAKPVHRPARHRIRTQIRPGLDIGAVEIDPDLIFRDSFEL